MTQVRSPPFIRPSSSDGVITDACTLRDFVNDPSGILLHTQGQQICYVAEIYREIVNSHKEHGHSDEQSSNYADLLIDYYQALLLAEHPHIYSIFDEIYDVLKCSGISETRLEDCTNDILQVAYGIHYKMPVLSRDKLFKIMAHLLGDQIEVRTHGLEWEVTGTYAEQMKASLLQHGIKQVPVKLRSAA